MCSLRIDDRNSVGKSFYIKQKRKKNKRTENKTTPIFELLLVKLRFYYQLFVEAKAKIKANIAPDGENDFRWYTMFGQMKF